jgi:hypothetical protein
MMDIDDDFARGGYYTVYVEDQGVRIPRVVFANSPFQAAHKVKLETGYLPRETDVDGPYDRGVDIPPIPSVPASA